MTHELQPPTKKKRPLSGPLLLPSGARLLLHSEDGVFRLLRNAELHHALGWNLDLLARGRLAAHPSLSVDEHQFTDARDREAVLRFLVRERREVIAELRL